MLNNFTFLAHLNTGTNDSRTRNCTNQSVQKGPRDPKLQQVYQRRKSGTKMHGDCCRLLLPAHANLEEGCFKNAQGVSLALETSRGVSYSKHTPIGVSLLWETPDALIGERRTFLTASIAFDIGNLVSAHGLKGFYLMWNGFGLTFFFLMLLWRSCCAFCTTWSHP